MGVCHAAGTHQSAGALRGGYLMTWARWGFRIRFCSRPGALTAQEWMIMRTHPARGVEICRHLKCSAGAAHHPAHHERFDGSGIPTACGARRFRCWLGDADCRHYECSDQPRCYKRLTLRPRLEIILEETGRGWRDPRLWISSCGCTKRHLEEHRPRRRNRPQPGSLRASLTTLQEFPADSVA